MIKLEKIKPRQFLDGNPCIGNFPSMDWYRNKCESLETELAECKAEWVNSAELAAGIETERRKLEAELAECKRENELRGKRIDELESRELDYMLKIEQLEKELNRNAVCDGCSELKVNCICKHGILRRKNA